jgi:hypothetical protein
VNGGANIPLVSGVSLTGLGIISIIKQVLPADDGSAGATAGPFRPPQWSKPAPVMITVPPPYVNTASKVSTDNEPVIDPTTGIPTIQVNVTAPANPPNTTPQYLVFDGVKRTSHSQMARGTEIPIQTGANLTDHILLEVPILDLDIIMTDVLPERVPGQWTGNASKSISCFQMLDSLRQQRVPLTVTTRLKTYENMYIVNIPTEDTVQTQYGLKARIQFKGMFIAQVAVQTYSARPQTTASTEIGTTQVTDPSNGVVSQNMLPSAATGIPSVGELFKSVGVVNGAGNWSSNNTSTLDIPPTDGS